MKVYQYKTSNTHAARAPGGSESADLVFVFGPSRQLASPDLIAQLESSHPNAQIVGCSTVASLSFGQSTLNETTVTAVQFKNASVKSVRLSVHDGQSSYMAGQHLASQLPLKNLSCVIFFADCSDINGTTLIKGIQDSIPHASPIMGAIASDESINKTTVMCNGPGRSKHIALVGIYGEHIDIHSGIGSGFTPFGTQRKITQSDGNIVYQIDHQPALELYLNYLGPLAKNLPQNCVHLPVLLENTQHEQRVFRSVININRQNHSMTYSGDMPAGHSIRLSQASAVNLLNTAKRATQRSLATSRTQPPELVMIFSGSGRKASLHQNFYDEIEAVSPFFHPKSNVCGLYTQGECFTSKTQESIIDDTESMSLGKYIRNMGTMGPLMNESFTVITLNEHTLART